MLCPHRHDTSRYMSYQFSLAVSLLHVRSSTQEGNKWPLAAENIPAIKTPTRRKRPSEFAERITTLAKLLET